ncbi:MAG TPA: glycosyltransferase [Gemmatimonadaceae bacterium]|nr:glycosyltransferase [Gemmatimonadaceae bacterium]
MRALHVIPSAAPVDGGPNVAVRALAEGLAAKGVGVTIATTNAAGNGTLDVPLETPVIDGGVVYRFFGRTVPGSWKFSWPLTRWLWSNARRYDVVHVHALFSYATIPGCRAAAHAPVPYVLRPLGTLSEWSLRHRAWKKRPYYTLLERSHLEGAAAIHVTSASEASDVARLGFGDRARVIPLGVAVPARRPQRAPAVGRPLRLLFLSRLHEKKNIPTLLRALAAVTSRGIELTIAGDGDAHYRAQLSAMVGELGLGGRVRFVGHVDGTAKHALLAESDCFVLPSAHENFGLAVAEALAAALPAIVSPGVALSAAVADAGAGVVVEPNDIALATALAWAAGHPGSLIEMGERAWRLARRSLSWDASCARLVTLYAEIAARERRAGRPA